MNRRGFLAALAGAVLDPERLLWRPGAKLISIPAPRRTTGGLFDPHADIAFQYWETWCKFQEKVFRQVAGMPWELTPFTEIPIVVTRIPGPLPRLPGSIEWEQPDSVTVFQTMTKEEFRRLYP